MVWGNHPVEVVGRIREQGCEVCSGAAAAVWVVGDGHGSCSCVRVRSDQGYRDFLLDGVSLSGQDSLSDFYARYVASRVDDVRCGGRCTIMMYGPTGAGKSHTMFGSPKEPGVAYLALRQVMSQQRLQVSANVLEIYNEDVYDLLAASASASAPVSSPSPGMRSVKSAATPVGRPKLEVRGKKVRNATSISGVDAAKLVQEIAKVEKRRVVKSTSSNDRSSRSHCMVVLDVLSVAGRLVLVDMAGSENSEQAGCTESKIQTGRINQGNSALKRVVECIANGSPYVPYRDSKLTMLLQDSFEDDGSKILMVLCASPDPKDVYKTICTFEYGAKAKCIVRLPRDGSNQDGTAAALDARLQFKDECLEKLRVDFEQRVKDHAVELGKLADKERELSKLRAHLERVDEEWSEKTMEVRKEMNRVMGLKSQELRTALELEVRGTTCCSDQERLSELERHVEDQKQEIELLRTRAETAEAEVVRLLQPAKAMLKPGEGMELQGLLSLDTSQLTQVTAVGSLNLWESDVSSPKLLPPPVARSSNDAGPEFDFNCVLRPLSACGSGWKRVEDEKQAASPTNSRTGGTIATCLPPSAAAAAAARRARIQNIFQLCGDGRERCKPGSERKLRPACPLRPVENQAAAGAATPPSLLSATLRRHGENRAPIQ